FSTSHLGQGVKQGVEHPSLNPAPIAAEDAVPLAIFVRQLPPLRTRPRHPHHTLEKRAIVTSRPAAAPPLRWQQRPDQIPLLIRKTNPLAQRCPQKAALNQSRDTQSSFVHEA